MAKAGRPSKLIPERIEKLLEAIRAGNYLNVAVVYAGISLSSFYQYMELADNPKNTKYVQFSEAVKKAEADAEARQVALVSKAAIDTWQAAAWMLERKHPNRWGQKVRTEVTGKDGGPVEIDVRAKLLGILANASSRIGEEEGAEQALPPGTPRPTVELAPLGKTESTPASR